MDSLIDTIKIHTNPLYFVEFVIVALHAIPLCRTPWGTPKFRAYRVTASQTILTLMGKQAFVIAT